MNLRGAETLAIIVVDGVEVALKAERKDNDSMKARYGWATTTQDWEKDQAERVGNALLFADRVARRLVEN